MTTLAVQQSVENFETWKPVFEDHEKVRRSHGSTGHQLLRDGNTVLVLIDFESAAGAAAFAADPSLHEAMERGGVQGAPSVAVYDDPIRVQY